MNHSTPSAEESVEPVSKSQRKRDSDALKALGVEMIALPAHQLDTVPLSEPLKSAIIDGRSITQHGAHKRHLKYIGVLLRTLDDVEPIMEALRRLRGQCAAATGRHHRIEQRRDRLIQEGDAALSELLLEYPLADRQHLRQLIRSAQHEQAASKPPRAARSLFKILRELFEQPPEQ